ncbi:MAG: multiheme c-type cytochrome, partial [Endozoicomonas sp.]
LSPESQACAACHKEKHPSIYAQWGMSKHYGANVGCFECHGANASDKDAIKHKGFNISVIVSPKDCGKCHSKEAEEFMRSHHASAGKIIGSLDNMLAEVIEGTSSKGASAWKKPESTKLTLGGESPAAVSGCWQCHGSEVKVLKNGDLDPATWPNTGIGRINPDGSTGTCAACHHRHEFSITQARRPEACGHCHLGPDHPQKEIYEESRHGIDFHAHADRLKMEYSKWIAGEDYHTAPTCSSCHMSATRELPVTHDVGDRISWNLRPAISEKIDAKDLALGKPTKSWLDRRKDMQNVCAACHAKPMVDSFYTQFDALVTLYNEKFARPGKALMGQLSKEGLITETPFDEKIEWTWFRLWHHEGRRARHGAAMQAPDYVQWHGMFEVAEKFYVELIPEYLEIVEKAEHANKKAAAERSRKVLDEILNRPEHAWFSGMEPESVKQARKRAQTEFKARYLNEKEDKPK